MFEPLLRWAYRQGGGRVVELLCADHPRPQVGRPDVTAVQLSGCAADLPWALPVELFAAGVDRVVFDPAGCGRSEELAARATAWAGLVDAVGRPGAVEILPTDPTADEDADATRPPSSEASERRVWAVAELPSVRRRGLFGLGGVPETPLPDPAASDWTRLRTAARALAGGAAPGGAEPTASGTGPGLRLAASDCTACGVCVRVCPEGALRLDRSVGRAVLAFEPARCSGCGQCVPACDPRALSDEGRLSWAALLADATEELAEVTTRRCVRCQGWFGDLDAGGLCPVCAYRRAHPFGTVLSPEAIERMRRNAEVPRG